MLNITIFNLTNQILTSKNYLESEIKASKKSLYEKFCAFFYTVRGNTV